MQFLIYSTENSAEAAAPPSPQQMEALGQLTQEGFQQGILVTTGGAQPTGTRVRLSGSKFSVTDGPFIELKELMGGFAVINVKTLEEAVEYTKRFRSIVGDGESEIIRIFGPADFGPADLDPV